MSEEKKVQNNLKTSPSSLENFDESLTKNKKTMMIACLGNPKLFSKISRPKLFSSEEKMIDRETVLEFSKKSNIHIHYLPTRFMEDEEILLNILRRYPTSYLHVCESLRKNKEFFLKCFSENICVLKYSPFSSDKEFVWELMKMNFKAYEFADKTVKEDKDLYLEYLKHRKFSLRNFPINLKDDRDFFLKAVKIQGGILAMNMKFFEDKEIMAEAIKNNGISIFNTNCEDEELIYCSIRNSKSGFIYLEKSLQMNKEIQQEALKYKKSLVIYLKDELNQDVDMELYIQCIRNDPISLSLGEKIRNNEELMMEAIKSNHKSFKNAPYKFKTDKKFVEFAVNVNGECLRYVPKSFRMDKEIIRLAMKSNGYALKFAPLEFQDDFEIVKEAILQKNSSIRFASLRLLFDKKLILNARSNILQYLPKDIRSDKEIVWRTKKYHMWIKKVPMHDLKFIFE
jgi:hypothetical protein